MKLKILVAVLLLIAAVLLITSCAGINNPFHVATEEEWLEADERGHLPFGPPPAMAAEKQDAEKPETETPETDEK